MNKVENDYDYINIVSNILYDDKFNEIRTIEHHGISRFDHSVRVSYYAYKLSKALKLNSASVARAGLLHDYFISDPSSDFKARFYSTFTHPKLALKTAGNIFDLTDMEADIIKTHMFPFYPVAPKYMESVVVNVTDKVIGCAEFIKKFNYKLCYAINLVIIFILSIGK